jgi:2-keto-3-deoxy-L-rhamnonate aldolase RhmA
LKNILKRKLRRGEKVIGTFVGLGHPDITELLSRLGFDWLVLDAEHAPLNLETMQKMMQSMNGTDCIPIARPQWNDPVQIKGILDIGAYGVLIPWVNSKEEAENAVRACKYPPDGIRGFGPRRAGMFDLQYFETANEEILIAIQIETKQALDNLDEILSVPGIDACYIGPYDLSCTLGLGIPPNWDDPKYLAAFSRILEAAEKHEKPAGMFATLENIDWALDKGFRFNTIGTADSFLMQGAKSALARVKREIF